MNNSPNHLSSGAEHATVTAETALQLGAIGVAAMSEGMVTAREITQMSPDHQVKLAQATAMNQAADAHAQRVHEDFVEAGLR